MIRITIAIIMARMEYSFFLREREREREREPAVIDIGQTCSKASLNKNDVGGWQALRYVQK